MREIALLLFMAIVISLLGCFIAVTPVYTSTRYAPGYSEKRFNQIKLGATEKQVRRALGNPLVEATNSAGDGPLIYSFPDHRYLVLHYKSRSIVLSNGVVSAKWSFVNNM